MDLVAYVCRVAESRLPERVARVEGARGAPRVGSTRCRSFRGVAISGADRFALQRRLVRQRLGDSGRRRQEAKPSAG